jgi:RNA polymerase sigma-B factor
MTVAETTPIGTLKYVSDAATNRAGEMITALAALPARHPARPAARSRTIEAWMPLARHLANRYTGRGEPFDDLFQVAAMGLIKAVDRFEADRGVDFAGFAIPTIVGELKRHFRDRTWSIKVPRRLQELRLAINAANSALAHSLDRPPTVADIAAHLGVTEEEVLEGLEGALAYKTTSLSTPVSRDGGTLLADTLGGLDEQFEVAEARAVLIPAMAALDERERKIVSLRFQENMTQSQIAEQVGISQMHVSRLLTRALAKMRRQLDGCGV